MRYVLIISNYSHNDKNIVFSNWKFELYLSGVTDLFLNVLFFDY